MPRPGTSRPLLTGVRPRLAVPGGRITLEGVGFPVDAPSLPDVTIGSVPVRIVRASTSALSVIVPPDIEGGELAVTVSELPDQTIFVHVGAAFVTGLHQVDNPAYDGQGNLYVTYSGSRGQQTPVSIYRVRPDGLRESFVTGLVNATSMAFDAHGRLHVSSRFDGAVYRIDEHGSAETVATDLGVACGLAFDARGTLYVGDRSGSIFRITPEGETSVFATLPSSVAAFHLALSPDGTLFVTAPTLSSYDGIYEIDREGSVRLFYSGLGRPQGLAFDAEARLLVVDALAGASGLYRFEGGPRPELVLSGVELIGVAVDPQGNLAVCSSETVYRFGSKSATH